METERKKLRIRDWLAAALIAVAVVLCFFAWGDHRSLASARNQLDEQKFRIQDLTDRLAKVENDRQVFLNAIPEARGVKAEQLAEVLTNKFAEAGAALCQEADAGLARRIRRLESVTPVEAMLDRMRLNTQLDQRR